MYESRTFAHLIGDPVARPWLYVRSIIRVMRETRLEVTSLADRVASDYAPASFAVPQEFDVVVSPADYDRLDNIGVPRVVVTVAKGIEKFLASHRGSVYRNEFNRRLKVSFGVDTTRDLKEGQYYIRCQSPCSRAGVPAHLLVWSASRHVASIDVGAAAAVSVGRGPRNHVQLERIGRLSHIPRRLSLWFVWHGSRCTLVNKGAGRSVRVRGQRMARGQAVTLAGGDIIQVGKRVMMEFALNGQSGDDSMRGATKRLDVGRRRRGAAASLHFWGYAVTHRMFSQSACGTLSLGSKADADFVLAGDSVDETHAQLLFEEDRLYIAPASTDTPVFIDGQPADHAALADGARVQVGTCRFTFRRGAGQAVEQIEKVLNDRCLGFLVFDGRSEACTVEIPASVVPEEGDSITLGDSESDFVRLSGRQMRRCGAMLERYRLQWMVRAPEGAKPVIVGFDTVPPPGQARALRHGDVMMIGPLLVEFRAA